MKLVCCLLMIFSLSIVKAQDVSIGQRVKLFSTIHNETRDLLIYTPPSYGLHESSKYPVLYIIDADYNFHYVTGLVELLSSISAHIPEMIVVGLSAKGSSTYRRESKPNYDVEDSGQANTTIQYIKGEVLSYVESHYATADYRLLAGHSIGGLFTTYTMLSEPQLFNAYIAISPSLWWQDQAVRTHTLKRFEQRQQVPAHYYITLGSEQGMGVHGFVEMLQSKGPRSLDLHFKHFPEETHGSVGLPSYRWALQEIFKDFRLNERHFVDAVSVKSHAQLSEKVYGVKLPIASGYLRNTSYAHAQDAKKIPLIEQAIGEYFPAQINQFRNIVIEGLVEADKPNEADEILTRALNDGAVDFETLANQSRLYHKQGKIKDALKSINESIKKAEALNIRQWLMNELIEHKTKLLGAMEK